MFVKVIIDNPSSQVDMEFEYETEQSIEPGTRVIVPFGKGNIPTLGIVLSQSLKRTYLEPLKQVIEVIDDNPVISKTQLEVLPLIRNEAICPKSRILNMMMPSSLRLKKEKYIVIKNSSQIDANLLALFDGALISKYTDKFLPFKKQIDNLVKEGSLEIRLNAVEKHTKKYETYYEIEDFTYYSSSPRRMEVMNQLQNGPLSESELINDYGFSKYVLNALVSDHAVKKLHKQKSRINQKFLKVKEDYFKPSMDYNFLQSSTTKVIKFNQDPDEKEFVYYLLKENPTLKVVFFVPEILKGYVISSFINKHFDKSTCYLNNTINPNIMAEYFERIKKDEFDVVVSTPITTLWDYEKFDIVVMMDEDSQIYKLDQSPRIDCVKIMKRIADLNNQRLFLTTFSLSMERYIEVLKSHMDYIAYPTFHEAKMTVVDTMKELRNFDYEILNEDAKKKLDLCIEQKEKAVLIINNRSYAKNIYCRTCHKTLKCPNCQVPLMYQKEKNLYKCPTCFYKKEASTCPICGKETITYTGFGMEQVMDFLVDKGYRAHLFDSVSMDDLDELNDLIDLDKIDIVVTTINQFISLSHPKLKLACFVDFDAFLNNPSFSSSVKSFNALEYVRCKSDEVIIQTVNPINPVIVHFVKDDVDGFYMEEIKTREYLKLKPIYDVDQILIKAPYGEMLKIASTIKKTIMSLLTNTYVVGPSYNYKEQKAQLIVKTQDKRASNVYLRIYEMYQNSNVMLIFDRNRDIYG